MKNINSICSKCIFFICLFTFLFTFKIRSQLPQNTNKYLGASITGTAVGSGSSDWIYCVKTESGGTGTNTWGTGFSKSTGGIQTPVFLKIDNTGAVIFEQIFSNIQGIGFDIHETPGGIFIFGQGSKSGGGYPPSLFSIKVDPITGLMDGVYGIKYYNYLTINIPAPQNGQAVTIVGDLENGKPHSRAIIKNNNLEGFIVSGNYYDNSYPSTFASSNNMTTGCFLLKLDVNGDPDPSFGSSGVQIYYQNTSTQFYGPHMRDVCVNYGTSGIVNGFVAVGLVNESPTTLQTSGVVGNDAFLLIIDSLGTVLYEDIYDDFTHGKNTGTPFSISYTDNTDISLCSNTSIGTQPFFLTQENSNERAIRVKQMGNGGDFLILSQFDYTYYNQGSSTCATTYPSTGFFIAADPVVMRMNSAGSIAWATNVFQSTGADFENDLIYDSIQSLVLVLGSTMQEPSTGTPVYQQAVLSYLDSGGGSLKREYVYDDTSSSQTMFCPFSFDFYNSIGLIMGGDNDLGNDDYEFIWVDPY